jgi:hypothetical protein
MKHLAQRKSLALRGAAHRRSVTLGIGASAIFHAALLAWVTFPGTAPVEDAPEVRQRAQSDALELISLRLPEMESETPEFAVSSASTEAGGSSAPDVRAEAPVADASTGSTNETTVETVDRVRLVSFERTTLLDAEIAGFGDIHAIEPADAPSATGHEGHLHTLAEEGPGFWDRLAEGFSIGVSAGGHCPMDADLIGAARDRGFSIPQVRGGGLSLPRAGGFSIPQSRGLGVRLPGGIGR